MNPVKRHLLLQFIILCSLSKSYGQSHLKFGYGVYEGFNIGTQHSISQNLKLETSIGYQSNFKYEFNYWATSVGISKPIKNISFLNQEKVHWYYKTSAIYWLQDDTYYNWHNLAIVPSLKKSHLFNSKSKISLDFGIAFNIVLHQKRKTFEEVAWPYHVFPNLSITYQL